MGQKLSRGGPTVKVPRLQGPTWMGLVMRSHFGRFCTFKPHHHKWFRLLSSPFPQSPSVPCLSATLGLGSWVVRMRLGHFSNKSGVTSSSCESRVQDQRVLWVLRCLAMEARVTWGETTSEIHEARSLLVKILPVTTGVRCQRRILFSSRLGQNRGLLW